MKNKYILKLLFLIIIVLSCENNTEVKDCQSQFYNGNYTFTAIDTVQLEIDSLTSNYNPFFQYVELNEKKLFSIYNKAVHRIQIYDIENKIIENIIELASNGENDIQELLGFHIHNFDSIFLFSMYENKIILINSLGEIKNSFIINDKIVDDIPYEIDISDYYEISFENNIINFWIAKLVNPGSKAFYQYPLIVDYNIEEQHIVKTYGNYPEMYRGDDIYFLYENVQKTVNDKHEVHYFIGYDKLILFDKNDKNFVKEVCVKSKFMPNKLDPFIHDGDQIPDLQKQFNYLIENGRYNRLLFDKTNKVNYRFVRHPQKLKDSNSMLNGLLESGLSVMILNDDYMVMGEIELPKNTFVDQISFISNGILWVNTNHPKNPNNPENTFEFILFNIIKN